MTDDKTLDLEQLERAAQGACDISIATDTLRALLSEILQRHRAIQSAKAKHIHAVVCRAIAQGVGRRWREGGCSYIEPELIEGIADCVTAQLTAPPPDVERVADDSDKQLPWTMQK